MKCYMQVWDVLELFGKVSAETVALFHVFEIIYKVWHSIISVETRDFYFSYRFLLVTKKQQEQQHNNGNSIHFKTT